MEGGLVRLLDHFRETLRCDPVEAFREWFRAQEELREATEAETSRALADDLWVLIPELSFKSAGARARFLHNAAVFYGSPGPSADLGRACALFQQTLGHFDTHAEDGWRARALHNLATAMGNLGTTPDELEQAVGLFHQALEWRTREREIARSVTLHNLGLALRRLADLDPGRAAERLAESASALDEAVEIRQLLRLEEGLAASREELRETRARLSLPR